MHLHHFENDWNVHHFTENKKVKIKNRNNSKNKMKNIHTHTLYENHLSHSKYPRDVTPSTALILFYSCCCNMQQQHKKVDSFFLSPIFSVHNYYMQSERNIPKAYFITFHICLFMYVRSACKPKRIKRQIHFNFTGCADEYTQHLNVYPSSAQK